MISMLLFLITHAQTGTSCVAEIYLYMKIIE